MRKYEFVHGGDCWSAIIVDDQNKIQVDKNSIQMNGLYLNIKYQSLVCKVRGYDWIIEPNKKFLSFLKTNNKVHISFRCGKYYEYSVVDSYTNGTPVELVKERGKWRRVSGSTGSIAEKAILRNAERQLKKNLALAQKIWSGLYPSYANLHEHLMEQVKKQQGDVKDTNKFLLEERARLCGL